MGEGPERELERNEGSNGGLKALLPRTQNMGMPMDINTIIILKNGASTSRPFTA